MKPNVQKSSKCYCMKLLTQPTQPSESGIHFPGAAPSMATLVFRRWKVWVKFGFFGQVIISLEEGRTLLLWESQFGLQVVVQRR